MASTAKYASVVLLVVVMMITVGAGAAAEEAMASSPSPTMDTGAASVPFVPSLFATLVASLIAFLGSRFY